MLICSGTPSDKPAQNYFAELLFKAGIIDISKNGCDSQLTLQSINMYSHYVTIYLQIQTVKNNREMKTNR